VSDKTLIADLEKAQYRSPDWMSCYGASMISRALTELKRREWKQISEAPKDGTLVLALNAFGVCNVVQWSAYGQSYNGIEQWRDNQGHIRSATHFMELPEPPQSTETKPA